MKRSWSSRLFMLVGLGLLSTGCTAQPVAEPAATSQPVVERRPLYEYSEADIDAHLAQLSQTQPDFRKRLITLARSNVGQPYELYLLGEAPFDMTDPQPVYNLRKSDCVVFAEHMLAMSLTDSFPAFLTMLQRIRYKDGHISCLTRNHYTEADWNINNRWLLREITMQLDPSPASFTQRVNRQAFFRDRYHVETSIPIQTITEPYIPYAHMGAVKPQLRSGDIVNFVKGADPASCWVHHVGIVWVRDDGEVWIIHSTDPKVREEPIDTFVARVMKSAPKLDAEGKPRGRGFKFHRIVDDPWASLRSVDGPTAPKVSVPQTSKLTWDEYVKTVLAKQ